MTLDWKMPDTMKPRGGVSWEQSIGNNFSLHGLSPAFGGLLCPPVYVRTFGLDSKVTDERREAMQHVFRLLTDEGNEHGYQETMLGGSPDGFHSDADALVFLPNHAGDARAFLAGLGQLKLEKDLELDIAVPLLAKWTTQTKNVMTGKTSEFAEYGWLHVRFRLSPDYPCEALLREPYDDFRHSEIGFVNLRDSAILSTIKQLMFGMYASNVPDVQFSSELRLLSGYWSDLYGMNTKQTKSALLGAFESETL